MEKNASRELLSRTTRTPSSEFKLRRSWRASDEESADFTECSSSSLFMPNAVKDEKVERSLQSLQNVAERLTPSVELRMSQRGLTMNQLRFSSLGRLYGRDEEISILNAALKRTIQKHDSDGVGPVELVMISGYSGAGKTSLARELEKPCRKLAGCFCLGKYDLRDQGCPYSGISAALTHLVEGILKTSQEDRLEELQLKLAALVGREGHVLRAVCPDFDLLLGDREYNGENSFSSLSNGTYNIGSAEEKAKLVFLLRKVIGEVCKLFCPVVIFLDDLQWVDMASLDILRALATDRDMSGLLIMGCYRSNEVGVDHKLPLFLRRLEDPGMDGREQVRLSSISVGNLDPGTIKNMLDDLLQISGSSSTETLARTLHTRTFGNIFFVIQFLKTLREMELLTFDLAQFEWRWDDEEIESSMNVTDNVAELMRLNIKKQLSVDAQKSLQIAACLGNEFEQSMLVLLITKMSEKGSEDIFEWDAPPNDVQAKKLLEQCVEFGFLHRRCSPVISYRFVHDAIQETVISLIGNLDLMKFRIGNVLVEKLSTDMLEQNLFVIVDVLNHGAKLECLEQSRSLLIGLNLRAGKKALKSSAFEAAAEYLAFSIGLLGHDCWDDRNYASSLDLFSAAAQAEFCNANLDRCRGYIDQILAQTHRPIKDKLPAYTCLIDSYNFQEQHSQSLSTNLMVLKQIGVNLAPENLLPVATLSSLVKTKRRLRNMDADDLLRLPPMTDKTKLMAMKLMDRALNACYMLNSPYFPVIEFKMVRWSVKYGICPQSAVAFVVYGLLLAGSLGELQRARVMAKVADELSRRPGLNETRSRVLMQCNGYVFHWTLPIWTCLKPLLVGYEVGMKDGDLENSFFNAYLYTKLTLCAGLALNLIHADMLDFSAQMRIYCQETVYQMCLPQLQFVVSMMDESAPNSPILSGQIMDYDEMMKHLLETNHVYLQDVTRMNQLQLAFYFGDYQLAWKMVEASKDFEKTNISHATVWRRVFFVGMTAFSLARTTANRSQSAVWKRKGGKALARLKKWVVGGNVNCIHMLRLLEAEEQALHPRGLARDKVLSLFQKSISIASRTGFIHDVALASERTAEYFSGMSSCGSVSSRDKVNCYIQLAVTYYTQWGATAKVDQLKQNWSGQVNSEIFVKVGTAEDGCQQDVCRASDIQGSSPTDFRRATRAHRLFGSVQHQQPQSDIMGTVGGFQAKKLDK